MALRCGPRRGVGGAAPRCGPGAGSAGDSVEDDKTLASAPPTAFLHVSPLVNRVLWYVALSMTVLVSTIYLLKVVFYFFALRIARLILALGAPRLVAEMHHGVWYALMAPIFCLELKIYGHWMSGGQRRLS
ncbi:hypothetical protein BS78_02G367000 [Paspalum vaginatum]|nr:hypothetical protein BS78_02G367000 [Paspalum vaginatum]